MNPNVFRGVIRGEHHLHGYPESVVSVERLTLLGSPFYIEVGACGASNVTRDGWRRRIAETASMVTVGPGETPMYVATPSLGSLE